MSRTIEDNEDISSIQDFRKKGTILKIYNPILFPTGTVTQTSVRAIYNHSFPPGPVCPMNFVFDVA